MTDRKTTFTPGPWYFKSPLIGYWDDRPDSGEEDFYHICQMAPGPNHFADAQLIAAAPDLYAALEQLYNHSSHIQQIPLRTMSKASQALAKARGES